MKSPLVAALVVLVATVVFQSSWLPQASACDVDPLFVVSPEHVASSDMSEPDGALRAVYREHWGTSDAPVIVGGYVVETVHTVEPDGDWTRGSLSVIVETWGEVPDDTGPFLHQTADLSVTPQDTCGDPGDGPELGVRRVHLVTDSPADFEWRISYRDSDETAATGALTSAFGESMLTERDDEAEQLLIAKLGNARSGAGTSIAIAFGAILVVGGIASYRYRKRRLLWQWDQMMAEAAEAEAAKQAPAEATES